MKEVAMGALLPFYLLAFDHVCLSGEDLKVSWETLIKV